jgi:hypothetical protein
MKLVDDGPGEFQEDGRMVAAAPPLACYANYFEIGHNAFEFLFDAGQVDPQSGAIRFTTRIAISPVQAKLLSGLLAQSIEQFERDHETIPLVAPSDAESLDLACPADFERRALAARRRLSRAASIVKER